MVILIFLLFLFLEIFRMDVLLFWVNFWGINLGDMLRFIYILFVDGKLYFFFLERVVMVDLMIVL